MCLTCVCVCVCVCLCVSANACALQGQQGQGHSSCMRHVHVAMAILVFEENWLDYKKHFDAIFSHYDISQIQWRNRQFKTGEA